MKALILVGAASLALAACDTTAPPASVSTIPVVATACGAISLENLNAAWKGYDAAIDAVNLLIKANVIRPGSPSALAVANANDKVLAAFTVAEHARAACDSNGYAAALAQVSAALTEIRAALHK
jgi:uncharacterized protein (DUF1330 family)